MKKKKKKKKKKSNLNKKCFLTITYHNNYLFWFYNENYRIFI